MAILSRRVFQTPLIKWIYPARIRNESKNDVVFVGETLIHLKEWNAQSGIFTDVASVENFGSKIHGAAILGERRPPDHTEAISSRSTDDKPTDPPPQILVLVLGAHQLVFVTATTTDHGPCEFDFHSRPIPVLEQLQDLETHLAIDAHARAMAFTNSERFLIVYGLVSPQSYLSTNPKTLVQTELVLPLDLTILKMEFLYPLREDPERVILFVFGLEEHKYVADIYSWDFSHLTGPESIQINRCPLGKEHSFPLSLIPLKSEVAGGYMMLVEEEHMLLYLVSPSGSMEQTSSIRLHENSLEELQKAQCVGLSSRVPLWTNWARPLRNPDWKHEVIYLGREDGAIKYVQIGPSKPSNKLVFEILGPGGNLDSNIDTAMAILDIDQARRNEHDHMDLYEIRTKSRDYQQGYPDVLVVASTSGNGGLYEIGQFCEDGDDPILSREELHQPQKRITFPNWGPLSALSVFAAANSYPHQQLMFQHPVKRSFRARPGQREKLFAAAGEQPHGAICELRHGFEAPLLISRYLQNPNGKREFYEKFDLKHCNGVWPIEIPGCDALFLFSYPWCSILAAFDTQTSTVSDRILFSYDEPTLDLTTLAFTSPIKHENTNGYVEDSGHTFVLCVCPTSVRVLNLQPSRPSDISRVAISPVQTLGIANSTCATFRHNSGDFLVAAPNIAENIGYEVAVKRIMFESDGFKCITVGKETKFNTEVSSLAFIELNASTKQSSDLDSQHEKSPGLYTCAVGMLSGLIHIFELDEGHGFMRSILDFDTSVEASTLHESKAIESILGLHISEEEASIYLLCGSRDGVLHILQTEKTFEPGVNSEIKVLGHVRKPAGDWPVHVLRDQNKNGCAIVYCGYDIGHIDLRQARANQPILSSVFFVDSKDPSFAHGSIDAMAQAALTLAGTLLSRCIVAVSQGMLLVGRISPGAKAIPRRRPIPGTPTRIIYSRQLNRLIVASTVSELTIGGNKRFNLSTIFLMDPNEWGDPDTKQEDIDAYDFSRTAYRCLPGERLLDLMEYNIPSEHEEESHHFVVATVMFQTEDGRDQGKILCLKDKQGLCLVHEAKEPAPVFAICQTKNGALVYCCGNDVRMRVYDPERKRFQKYLLIGDLASPGVEISIKDSLVMIVTQLHSLRVYSLDEENKTIVSRYNDFRPRMGISSLDLPEMDMVLMPTTPNTIAGFRGAALTPEFEASLPNQVIQLVKANLRPPWKKDKAPGIDGGDIFGVAIDGSLFSFSFLTAAAFRLLRFLESMCLSDKQVCPFPRMDSIAKRPFDPQKLQLKDMHIDGDILAALLKMPHPELVLEDMLNREPPKQAGHALQGISTGNDSSTEKRVQLADLLDELLKGTERRAAGSEADTAIDLLRHFLELPL